MIKNYNKNWKNNKNIKLKFILNKKNQKKNKCKNIVKLYKKLELCILL